MLYEYNVSAYCINIQYHQFVYTVYYISTTAPTWTFMYTTKLPWWSCFHPRFCAACSAIASAFLLPTCNTTRSPSAVFPVAPCPFLPVTMRARRSRSRHTQRRWRITGPKADAALEGVILGQVLRDYHPKGLEPKGLDPKALERVSNPKGLELPIWVS